MNNVVNNVVESTMKKINDRTVLFKKFDDEVEEYQIRNTLHWISLPFQLLFVLLCPTPLLLLSDVNNLSYAAYGGVTTGFLIIWLAGKYMEPRESPKLFGKLSKKIYRYFWVKKMQAKSDKPEMLAMGVTYIRQDINNCLKQNHDFVNQLRTALKGLESHRRDYIENGLVETYTQQWNSLNENIILAQKRVEALKVIADVADEKFKSMKGKHDLFKYVNSVDATINHAWEKNKQLHGESLKVLQLMESDYAMAFQAAGLIKELSGTKTIDDNEYSRLVAGYAASFTTEDFSRINDSIMELKAS